MSEYFDESEPEVPLLLTRPVESRKRSSPENSTPKGLGSKRVRVLSRDRTSDVDEVIARINDNTPPSTRRNADRENQTTPVGRRATSAPSAPSLTSRAQKVATTPRTMPSSKYVRKTPRSEKRSSHRFPFEVDNVGGNPLSDPRENDSDSDLDLVPSSTPSSPPQSPPPSPPPSTPPAPNVAVALKEITSLLNTVVKRMDRMESELKQRCSTVSSSSPNEPRKAAKSLIPLIVKSEVRKTYKMLLEDEEDNFEGFDFNPSVPFNGPSNEDVVARLIKEVKANNPQFQVCHIRAAAYTYYRSKSQENSLKERGKYDERNRTRRRRERLLRKLQERTSTLQKTDMPSATKDKWAKVLQPDTMSSEESDTDSEDVFIKPIPWRAECVNSFFLQLDEKRMERKTSQAKRQRKNRMIADTPSTRSAPAGLPKWAIKKV